MKILLLLALLLAGVAPATRGQSPLPRPVGQPNPPITRGYRDGRYRQAGAGALDQMTISGQVFRVDSFAVVALAGASVSVAVLPGGAPVASIKTDKRGHFSLVIPGATLASLPDSLSVLATALFCHSQTVKVRKAALATVNFHLQKVQMQTLRLEKIPTTKASAANKKEQAFWPPPECSTLKRLTNQYFAKAHSLADVDNILSSALNAAAYDDLRYYYAPGGFVLITRIEQTDANGVALPGSKRWSVEIPDDVGSSFASYLRALFLPPSGHFRVIAFAITNEPIASYRAAPQEAEARQWLQQGADELDATVGALPYGPDYHCTALIYEFQQSASGAGMLVVPGKLTAEQHLTNSHISRALPHPQP